MAGQRQMERLKENGREHDGQALAEYVFILMLVALVCIAALTLLGGSIQGVFTGFSGNF